MPFQLMQKIMAFIKSLFENLQNGLLLLQLDLSLLVLLSYISVIFFNFCGSCDITSILSEFSLLCINTGSFFLFIRWNCIWSVRVCLHCIICHFLQLSLYLIPLSLQTLQIQRILSSLLFIVISRILRSLNLFPDFSNCILLFVHALLQGIIINS